jgi:hypothetical protein
MSEFQGFDEEDSDKQEEIWVHAKNLPEKKWPLVVTDYKNSLL